MNIFSFQVSQALHNKLALSESDGIKSWKISFEWHVTLSSALLSSLHLIFCFKWKQLVIKFKYQKYNLFFFVLLLNNSGWYERREEKGAVLCYFPDVVFSELCVMLIIIQLSLLPPRVYLILSQICGEDWAGNNSNHNNLVCPHIHTQTNSTTVTFTSPSRTQHSGTQQ